MNETRTGIDCLAVLVALYVVTIVVGAACAWGIDLPAVAYVVGTGVALVSIFLLAALQVRAFRLSLIPFIARQ